MENFLKCIYKQVEQGQFANLQISDNRMESYQVSKDLVKLESEIEYQQKKLSQIELYPALTEVATFNHKRLKIGDISEIPFIWCEFIGDIELIAENTQLNALNERIPTEIKPSILYHCGSTVYGIWIFDRPYNARTDGQKKEFIRLLQAFQRYLNKNAEDPRLKIEQIDDKLSKRLPLPSDEAIITENTYKIEEIWLYCGEISRELAETLRKLKIQTVGSMIFNAPEKVSKLIFPGAYTLSSQGIYSIKHQAIVIDSPIFITKYMKEVDIFRKTAGIEYDEGKIGYELTAMVNNRWISFITSPKSVQDSTQIHKILSERGVLIDSTQSKYAVSYFKEFMKINAETIERVEIYTQTGWHGNKFILPSLNEGYYVNAGQSARELHIQGDSKTTKELIKIAIYYPAARIMIAANLAAPLLEVVNCRNFSINIWGRTESGKTAAMQLANSIWGSPKYMHKFNSTNNAVEAAGIERNSLPLNCNEWQTTDKRFRDQIADQIIHRYGEGEEKGRLNRNAQMKTSRRFRGILIITAEESLINQSVTGGVKTRLLEFNYMPALGTYNNDTNQMNVDTDLCQRIYQATQDNYGHIGVEYIKELIKANKQELRRLYKERTEYIYNELNCEVSMSHCQYLAVLALADYLLQIWIYKIDELTAEDCTTRFFNELSKGLERRSEISDATRAKDDIISWWYEFNRYFYDKGTNENPMVTYGFWKDGELYANSSRLMTMLREKGYQPTKILKELSIEGLIEYNEREKRYSTIVKDPENRAVRVIKLPFIEQSDNKEEEAEFGEPPKMSEYAEKKSC